ncbi:MAG: hypothetical protein ABI851_05680 [Saprospiraceae bacterium]
MKLEFNRDFLGHSSSIYCLEKGLNEDEFFSAGSDKKIVQWNLNENIGKQIALTDDVIFSMAIDHSQNVLFCGSEKGYLYRINLNGELSARMIKFHTKPIYGLQLVKNSLFVVSGDGILSEFDTKEFTCLNATKIFSKGLRCLVYYMEEEYIIIGAQLGMLFKYDLKNKQVIQVAQISSKKTIFSLAIDKIAKVLIVGGMDALLRVYELNDFIEKNVSINAHWFTINDLLVLDKQQLLISASRDKKIRIWKLSDLELLKEFSIPKFPGHSHSVNKLLWLDSSNSLLSASDDRTIKCWQIN